MRPRNEIHTVGVRVVAHTVQHNERLHTYTGNSQTLGSSPARTVAFVVVASAESLRWEEVSALARPHAVPGPTDESISIRIQDELAAVAEGRVRHVHVHRRGGRRGGCPDGDLPLGLQAAPVQGVQCLDELRHPAGQDLCHVHAYHRPERGRRRPSARR